MIEQLQSQMRSLKSSIEANCLGPDATSQLRAIVDRSDGVLLRARNNTVKMALQAPDLDLRFTEVADAYDNTFDWILDGPDHLTPELVENGINRLPIHEENHHLKRRDATLLFVDWLKTGTGSSFTFPGSPLLANQR